MRPKQTPGVSLSDELNSLHQVHEKRSVQDKSKINEYYQKLSLAQKISASHLTQFGFELTGISGYSLALKAIFTSDLYSISVDYYGEIERVKL